MSALPVPALEEEEEDSGEDSLPLRPVLPPEEPAPLSPSLPPEGGDEEEE